MGAVQEGVTIMHSAYSLVGEFEGGAGAFLDTLIEYFTKDGGIFCVPTHTWHKLECGEGGYTLDMTRAESCVGLLSVLAIGHKKGVRTKNPTHSMVVFGQKDRIAEFIKDEECITTPTAPESCYGKLYDMGGQVLLIGVAQNKNTYLHAVGEILKLPDRMSQKPCRVSVLDTDGSVCKKDFYLYETSYINDISLRFTKYETAFRYHGAIRDGFIGDAPTQVCNARAMLETVQTIYQNANGADPLASEKPIKPKLYRK